MPQVKQDNEHPDEANVATLYHQNNQRHVNVHIISM